MWTFLQQKVICSACIRTRSNEKKLENLFAFDFFNFVLLNKPGDIYSSNVIETFGARVWNAGTRANKMAGNRF